MGLKPTTKLIKIINALFGVLNLRNLSQFGFKKPLSSENYDQVATFLNDTDYLSNLKASVDGSSILDIDRHTGFFGTKNIYKYFEVTEYKIGVQWEIEVFTTV